MGSVENRRHAAMPRHRAAAPMPVDPRCIEPAAQHTRRISMSPAPAHRWPANVLMLSGVIAAFHLGKVSPAIPVLQHSLGLTRVEAGFLLSLMQVAGASVGVIMGMFSDSFGARRSLITGHVLLGLSSLLALAAGSAGQLLALRAVESLGLLMIVLSTPAMLRIVVPPQRLSFRLGLWGCYMAIGTASAFVLGPYVIEAAGWKGWWLLPALLSLLAIGLLAHAVPSDRTAGTARTAAAAAGPSWRQRLWTVLSCRNPWLVGLAFAMYSGQWIAIIGFLPLIYVEAGMTDAAAGLLTALASLVNIVGNIAAAVLIHRGVSQRRLLALGYFFILSMTIVAFSSATQGLPVLRYLAILLFSAVGGVIPATLFILVVRTAPSDKVIAASVGWMQQLSSLGMLLMPPLLARLADLAGGWHWTWLATSLAAVIGFVLAAMVARPQLEAPIVGPGSPVSASQAPSAEP